MSTTYHLENKISKRKEFFNSLRKILNRVTYYIFYRFSSATFIFRSRSYRYFFHPYNTTWRNERSVEVPIAIGFMEEMKKKRVLEVGNVLRYYYPVRHDTLDKYEFGDGVLSLDIVDFHPKEKYDLIVTISTLEHVGWDEEPQNPKKLDAAFQNLVDNCLAPGGVLVITLPIGYNSYVDELLSLQKTIPGEKYFLKRKAFSEWREVPYEEVRGMKYNSPFPSSNAICISIYQKMNS